jgi:hypothetical protein
MAGSWELARCLANNKNYRHIRGVARLDSIPVLRIHLNHAIGEIDRTKWSITRLPKATKEARLLMDLLNHCELVGIQIWRGSPMGIASEYEKCAAECMALVERFPPHLRPTLLKMAEAWLQLAVDALDRKDGPHPNAPSTGQMQ